MNGRAEGATGRAGAFISRRNYPEVGSPILIIPLAVAAGVFIVFGLLTFGTCNSYNVSLVWFGLAALTVAALAGMFANVPIVAFALVFGLLCIAVGFLTMPAGCAFAWQV